jgi:hypothetical protein
LATRLVPDAEHCVAAHGQSRIERGLLGQIADLGACGDEALADELGVQAGHDAQKRRLARAVDAEHAILASG